MAMRKEVEIALRSKVGIVWIPTEEESRIERILFRLAESRKYTTRIWSCTKGLEQVDYKEIGPNKFKTLNNELEDPSLALEVSVQWEDTGSQEGEKVLTIFRDLNHYLEDVRTRRAIRDASTAIKSIPDKWSRIIIIMDSQLPCKEIPGIYIIDADLPTEDEIEAIVDKALETTSEEVVKNTELKFPKEQIIKSGLGCTADQIRYAISKSIVEERVISPHKINDTKRALISKSDTLNWIDTSNLDFNMVGGLNELISYAKLAESTFSDRSRAYGIPYGKGFFVVGPPGTGKSLIAKCVAGAWNVPLLQFEMGSAMSKYLGDSEAKMSKMIKIVESVGKCVLWIDEYEKALGGGSSSGETDGGTTKRMVQSLLSWQNEKTSPVYIVATANNVQGIDAEFLRAGRFDSLWFVDLPNEIERVKIAQIMSRKYPATTGVDSRAVAVETEGYSGAEIEQGFIEGMKSAFFDGERKTTVNDVLKEMKRMVPMAKTMKEKISAIRRWSRERCRPATITTATTGCATDFSNLDI